MGHCISCPFLSPSSRHQTISTTTRYLEVMPYNTRKRTRAAVAYSESDRASDSEPNDPAPQKRVKRTKAVSKNDSSKSGSVRPKGKGILRELPNMPLDIIDEVGLCSFYVDIQVRMKRLTQWDHDRFFHIWN